MGVGIIDAIFLLLTAITAIYLIYKFFQYKPAGYLWHSLAFLVLIIAGVLILIKGLGVLHQPWVKIVATLMPFAIAIGLMVQYYKKLSIWWIVILGLGFILIALNTYGKLSGKFWYPIFHAFAGLTIFFVPILVVSQKRAPNALLWVTVGGALIGLGGIALAFLSMGKKFLFFSESVVNTILTPLLFLMTLAYAVGFIQTMRSQQSE